MTTTTKTAAPKSTDATPKPTTLAERAKAQKADAKTAAAGRKPAAAKRAPKTTKTTDAPKAAKRGATKTTPTPTKPKTDPKSAAPVDVDRVAAARATELLRFGGAYANASGVSAKQLRDFGAALDVPAMAALSGGKSMAKAAALKLATGESKPSADQKAAWAHATKRYAKRAFGVDGPTTKNKITGRKIACVLAAIAERDGTL